MQTYIGTKVVKAKPMNRAEYNEYRGWELPADENGADEGMLVEYSDSGKANDSRHEGYISWSPLDVFNNAYRDIEEMTFSQALDFLKSGGRVARSGWNGKGMWLMAMEPNLSMQTNEGTFEFSAYIGMKTADDMFVPWLASQTDLLAEDWALVKTQS